MGKKLKKKKSALRGFAMLVGRSRRLLWTVVLLTCVYLLIWYVGIPTLPRGFFGFSYISSVSERYEILEYRNGSSLYVMNEENMCNGDKHGVEERVDLLIAVITAPKYSERRDAIRKTWGGIVKKDPKIKVVFFLGVSTSYDEGKLWYERSVNHDMIQVNYTDTYGELTFKSIIITRWVGEYCDRASYVLKTDDDALVNVENLMTSLEDAHSKHRDFIMCYVWKGAPVVRAKKHKYFVPYTAYRKRVYPNYCGGLYAFTANISRELYETSLRTPFIPMEDVYMTGMVASQLQVPLVHTPQFVLDQSRIRRRRRKINPCIYKNISIYVEYTPNELQTIWEKYDPMKC